MPRVKGAKNKPISLDKLRELALNYNCDIMPRQDPAPVDPAPVDPAPVDPAPVDPAPVDPAPVDPAPGDKYLDSTNLLIPRQGINYKCGACGKTFNKPVVECPFCYTRLKWD